MAKHGFPFLCCLRIAGAIDAADLNTGRIIEIGIGQARSIAAHAPVKQVVLGCTPEQSVNAGS